MKATVLFVFLLFSLVLISDAAAPSCTFRVSCETGEVNIYGLTSTTNAHASTSASATNLCCTTDHPLNFGTACTRSEGSAVTFLELSSAINAHAGVPASSSYSTNLCINAQKAFLSVAYSTTCTPAAGYSSVLCLGSYSSSTNAHLGTCDTNAYSSKVCLSTAFDYAAPAIDLTLVPAQPTPGQSFILVAAATDSGDGEMNAGIRTMTVTFDGSQCATETWTTPTTSRTLTCSLSRSLVGAYPAEVTAADFFGNSHTVARAIAIVPAEPYDSALILSKENDGTADPAAGSRQVFAFLSHTGSYLTSCELNWGDGTVETVVPETASSVHTYAADGTKNVQYRCYDQYREFDPTPATQTIIVDTSPPAVLVPEFVSTSVTGVTVVPAPVFSSNRTPLIRGLASEQENGALIGQVDYQIVNVTLPGTRLIIVPFTPLVTSPPLPTRLASYEFSVPPALLADGTYAFEVRATHQGGLSSTGSLTAILDTEPPTGTVTINSGSTATNFPFVSLSTTFADSRSGVAGCRFKRGGGTYGPLVPCTSPVAFTLPDGEGTKTVVLQVADQAGNTVEASDTIIVDTTVPLVAVAGAPANFTNQSTPAGVVCSDVLAGCDDDSFSLLSFSDDPGQCPADYADYTDSAPQLIDARAFVCAAAKDFAGNTGISSPTLFLVDKTPPNAGILPFPVFINTTSFTVGFWGGIDSTNDGGDVAMLDIEYNATSAGHPGNDFVPFLTSFPSRSKTFGPTRPNLLPTVDCDLATDPIQCVEDGQTYRFRARARDFAGNLGDFSDPSLITVDRTPPACQFLRSDGSPLSPFNREQFTLRWSVTDATSGVAGFSLSFTNDTGPHPLSSICADVSNGLVGSASCQGQVNEVYTFSCAATDNTGNTISTQAATQLIDIAGAAFLDQLPLYASNASPLWNDAARTILLNWNWLEMGPAISCFNVQYANETLPYTDVVLGGSSCIPPATTTTAFGPLPEHSTYRFRVRVIDTAGTAEPFSDILLQQQINTTVDSRAPTLNLTITDNKKTKLDLRETTFITADIDNITIVANATDATSNLTSHTFLIDTGIVTQRVCTLIGRDSDCAPFTIDTDDDFTLRVEATDSAQNQNATRKFQFIRHPVAGFVARQRYLSIGETVELAITVRNLQNVPATVTLFLCAQEPGTLQATQTSEHPCPSNINVAFAASTDNPITRQLTLSAQSEQTVVVRVSATSVGSSILRLFSSSTTGTNDRDTIILDVGFPPEFPDMASWSVALLMIVSLVVYGGFFQKKERNTTFPV